MKKSILNKLILITFLTAFTALLMTIKSNAASLSITTSKSSVSPGESFTVTVKLNNGAGSVSSGGQTQWLDNSSFSYTKKAGSSGSITITASGTVADYTTEKDQTVSASKTVKIVSNSSGGSSSSGTNKSSGGSSSSSNKSSSSGTTKQNTNTNNNTNNTNTSTNKVEEEKSKDSTLNALSIKEGAITPEFKKDVKEYLLSIPYEIEEVNVTATPSDSKATVTVNGNKKLKEGENKVTVVVTAEDGSKTNYIIKVTRKRVPIALKSLIVKCENEKGELVELPLNPGFTFENFEYVLEDIEYWIEKLNIEAIPNVEGAIVDIQGAENLQVGENVITITLTIDAEDQTDVKEGEEAKKETIVYTIKVNKKGKPSLGAKISNWFKGIAGTISSWYNNNQTKVIFGSLMLCVVALIGLSIYIVIDYNKYKDVIAKVKKTSQVNTPNKEIINEIYTEEENMISDIYNDKKIEKDNKNNKPKGGKHF